MSRRGTSLEGHAQAATFLSTVTLLLVAGVAHPQEEEAEVPRFPTRVELVTVDVVVTDSEGQPVGGLGRGDFALTEDGVPQTLSTFEAIELPERPTVAPIGRSVVSTNVPSEAAASPDRWFGLVLDDLHLDLREAGFARKAAAAFVQTAVRDGDQVTLAITSSGVWWRARMPAGRQELLALLGRVEARELPALDPDWLSPYEAQRIWVHRDRAVADYVERRFASNGLRRADLVLRARAPEVYSEALARNRQTLEVMERMLVPLEGADRPGALVLVSGGFFHDSTLAGLEKVLEASHRSNVPVHFVDSRALMGMPAHFGADRGVSSAPGVPVLQGLDRPATEPPPGAYTGFDANRDERFFGASGSESLALDSGGLLVHNTNDPTSGLQRIADESRVYYLLGYHPTNTARDGTYRTVEVKASRPDLVVRARKGYRAPLEGETRAEEETVSEDAWFQRALDSPLDQTEIPLRVAAYTFEEVLPGTARVVLATEVDIRGLAFEEQDGRAADTLDVMLLVAEPGAGEVIRHDLDADLKLRPETRRALEAGGFPIIRELELSPGSFQARVVVRDRNGGRLGSVAHHFEVPDLAGLRASSVLLTDALETVPNWTMSQREPRIVAHREFPTGTTLFVHYEVYGAAIDPGTGRPRVRSGLEIRRLAGPVLGRGEPVAIAPSSDGRLSRTSELGLARADPGDYELALTITDDVAARTLRLREEFTLVEPGGGE